MTDSQWRDFENLMLQFAEIEAYVSKADPYDYTPPTQVALDLEEIDEALTRALQKLEGMRLEHRDGQDISKAPFNWPVTSALQGGWLTKRLRAGQLTPGKGPPPEYPSNLIRGLRELRDIARIAVEEVKPERGNSSERSSDVARAASLARNFVFRFRMSFGVMPPMSKTGRAVNLLNEMFQIAGVGDKDAADYVRTAIKRAKAGTAWVRKRSK